MGYETYAIGVCKIGSIPLIVTGGTGTIASEAREIRGIGSHLAASQVAGLVVPTGSVDFTPVEKTVLQLAHTRTAGILGESTIIAGDTTMAITNSGCKIGSLRLSAAAGEELKASLTWTGLTAVQGSTASMTLPTTKPWMWNQAAFTNLTVEPISMELSIDNGLKAQPVIETPEDLKVRAAKYVIEGDQKVVATFRLLNKTATPASIVADDLAEIASATIIFTSGSNILTITLTGLLMDEQSQGLAPGGFLEHGARYNIRNIAIT